MRSAIENCKNQTQDNLSNEWQMRSAVWFNQSHKSKKFRPARQRSEQPLILTGHGVSLRIERNTLLVKNGFTHYPQEQEIIRLFPGDLSLPPRIMFLDCSGSISFRVLSWLKDQNIDAVHVDWQGEIIATTSNSGYAARPEKAQWQRQTRENHDERMLFCSWLISRKLEQSLITLDRMNIRSDEWRRAMDFLEICMRSLSEHPSESVTDLFSLEANCALAYFRAWRGVTLAWKGKSRKIIPSNWAAFDQRSPLKISAGNRHARHPINALLNYAYRVAESALFIQSVGEGYDPTIGILHEGRINRNAFLYDLIELERAQIDYLVFDFVRSNVFAADDFAIMKDGTVRLNPQLAGHIANLASRMPRPSISEKLGLDIEA